MIVYNDLRNRITIVFNGKSEIAMRDAAEKTQKYKEIENEIQKKDKEKT